MKTSTMVMRRVNAVRRLALALRKPHSEIFERLEKRLGAPLPGGERTFHLLADYVLRELDRLRAADNDKFNAEVGLELARQLNKKTAAELYQLVVASRDSVFGAFGRRSGKKLMKLEGRISRNPDNLLSQADTVGQFLRWQATSKLAPRPGAGRFDPQARLEDLEPVLRTLEEAQTDIETKNLTLALCRAKWKKTMAEVDDACRHAIKVSEGWHDLGGLDARLGSFRTAIRKRRYRQRETDDGAAPETPAENPTGAD